MTTMTNGRESSEVAAPADAYVVRYMTRGEHLVHVDKRVSPGWLLPLSSVASGAALAALFWRLMAGHPGSSIVAIYVLLVYSILIGLGHLLDSSRRTVVTDRTLRFQQGTFLQPVRSIPLESLERVTVMPKRRGGRLRLAYRDDQGEVQEARVDVRHPEAVVATLERLCPRLAIGGAASAPRLKP
jgi:hypothetical protein